MATPTHDDKALEGSVNEKDTQVGASEEIYIDPVAEKKVWSGVIRCSDIIDTF